jgi:hypothetical protein
MQFECNFIFFSSVDFCVFICLHIAYNLELPVSIGFVQKLDKESSIKIQSVREIGCGIFHDFLFSRNAIISKWQIKAILFELLFAVISQLTYGGIFL